MSIDDYVQFGLKGSTDFGIQGYKVAYTCELDKPQIKKIHPGKRTTYLDDAMKSKKFVPPAKYEIMGDLVDKKHKSKIDKAKRKTMADEIAA